MPRVLFENEYKRVECAPGATLRDVALANGIDPNRAMVLHLLCRGHGICGECKVWVKEAAPGATNGRTLAERARGYSGWRRLACQTKVLGDVNVWTAPGGPDRLRTQRDIMEPPSPVEERRAQGGAPAVDEAGTERQEEATS